MSRSFRLTRRAEDSLTDIARWTIDSFGLRQAEIYQEELLNCCAAILNGEAYSRSCGVLVDDADDLRFVRAGEHYLVFLDQPDEVVIVDILHSRSDLPRYVAALMALKNKGFRSASQPRRLGQVDAEPVTPALIAPGHFGAGMAKVFLDMAFIDLGAAGKTGA